MRKTFLAIITLLMLCLTVSAFTFEQPRHYQRRPPVHRRAPLRHNHPNPRSFYPRTCPACGAIARRHHRYRQGPPPRQYRQAPPRRYRQAPPPRRDYRAAPRRR